MGHIRHRLVFAIGHHGSCKRLPFGSGLGLSLKTVQTAYSEERILCLADTFLLSSACLFHFRNSNMNTKAVFMQFQIFPLHQKSAAHTPKVIDISARLTSSCKSLCWNDACKVKNASL